MQPFTALLEKENGILGECEAIVYQVIVTARQKKIGLPENFLLVYE